MDSISSKQFYVYTLALDEAMTQPFYVGKGRHRRVFHHDLEAESGALSPKCAVVRYCKRRSGRYFWGLNHETDDEGEAFWHEMKIITSYPYGRLCNLHGGIKFPVTVLPARQHNGGWSTLVLYQRHGEQKAIEVEQDTAKAVEQHAMKVYDDLVLRYYADASGYYLGCRFDWS